MSPLDAKAAELRAARARRAAAFKAKDAACEELLAASNLYDRLQMEVRVLAEQEPAEAAR